MKIKTNHHKYLLFNKFKMIISKQMSFLKYKTLISLIIKIIKLRSRNKWKINKNKIKENDYNYVTYVTA